MKKFKSFKKLLVFGLAVATIFSMAGITSFAADGNIVKLGNIELDLTKDKFDEILAADGEGANNDYLVDLTNKELNFTTSNAITLGLVDGTGKVYGYTENKDGSIKKEPIKKSYDSNIKLLNGTILNVLWNIQKPIPLNEYTFINSIPENINLPVPIYIEDAEANPSGWNFRGTAPDGYTNTVVTISELRKKFENKKNWDFISNQLSYRPTIDFTDKYGNKGGEDASSANPITWIFNAPMSVKYTVDIAPVTAGGTPKLTGLSKVEYDNIHETNKVHFRNGDINKNIENGYAEPAGVTGSGMAAYGSGFGTKDNAKTEDGYKVAYVRATVHDPLTGETQSTETYYADDSGNVPNIPSVVNGQTEIRVAYGKKVEFTKVDEKGDPITGVDKDGNGIDAKAAEFTVYTDKDKKETVGSVKSDPKTGKVVTPMLTLPEFGEPAKTYYVEETKAPEGYEKSNDLCEITINSNGVVTYGNGFENGSIKNPEIKEPVIIKSSNPVSGEYVKKGQDIKYTLTIKNDSNNDRNIIVEDELPDGIEYDSRQPYLILNEEDEVINSGRYWSGQWSGQIKAKSELKIVIPTRVMRNFDANDTNKNIFVNQASLQTESLTTPNEYGEKQFTDKVVHYLTPKVSYTMEKARVTQPKEGLKGFIAGAGEVIDYKVTLKNTGDLKLDIDLKDVFKNNDYFTFVSDSENKVTLEVGETKAVTFKATVNPNTPEEIKTGYLNTVTSEGKAEYVDPKTYHESMDPEKPEIKIITINKDTQKDLEKTSPAYTPVIVVGDPTITKTSDIESQSFIDKDKKITYTLTVTNPYSTARDILVTDILPKQVEAGDDYLINGQSQGKAWDGSYEGKIEANGKLVFEIPVTVIDSFNNKDHESNTISNTANLKVKDLLTEKYGNEIPTKEIIHYLEPAIGYTMTKERITDPDKGLDGFYAGTGQVIDYKVTLVNTGDITLDIDLEDVFVNAEYFEFVDTNKASVTIEPGETREVIFKATIKAGTPANASYENIVTSIAQGWYLNARTGERVIVNQDNWPDAVTTARVEDDAITPVIVPEVKPAKPGVATGDNSSIALFGSLAVISGLALVLKRKKED